MPNSTFDSSTSSSRKTLLERLASLRIQSSVSNNNFVSNSRAPESPSYIPRSTQTTNSKSHNYSQSSNAGHDVPSSPTIGRRRKLTGLALNASNSSKTMPSPIGISSPKYFPKQKVLDIEEPISSIQFTEIEESQVERKHSAKEVVTNFIDSFTALNNFLMNSSNSTSAKLELQNMNTSFAALQMDLKAAISTINQLQHDLKEKNDESASLKSKNDELFKELNDLKSQKEQKALEKDKELEEQLNIALSQIAEIKIAFEKEKGNVEFLQNYMEEVIQLKDEGEQKIAQLEKRLAGNTGDAAVFEENERLKETIKLLEMERASSKNVCKQALEVLDAAKKNENNKEEVELLHQELKQKQSEIEKLKGREKHFKESNEIFQQKLVILTEENRKLKGQRPLNHY